jgi:ABC-type polysaccharide/polyol phosphate transport system ATPase subunit
MSDIVIKAENIGKMYTIGHQAENGRYTALRDVLMHNARNLWNKTKDLATGKAIIQGDTMEEVWALKDLSFEIRRGEAVGIIGRNGAGKSTLLKILSRITEPSAGRVTIKGRVASLLEVGTGFHPELSGRENIYLNGTILGMTRVEIKQKFDEIVAFAEVEKYLDTPVKRYSSGMYVRLAFAVAAHLEPEILIVDEVLAVGDVQFQKKCLGKMKEVGKEGRTVLFVSHNMGAIQQLTNRCIVLSNGEIVLDGESYRAVATYNIVERSSKSLSHSIETNYAGVRLESIDFEPVNECLGFNRDITFKVSLCLSSNVAEFTLGLQIINSIGARIATLKIDIPFLEAGHRQLMLLLKNHYLPPGNYSINVGMDVRRQGIFYEQDLFRIELSDEGIEDSFLTSRRDKIGVFFPVEYKVS